MAWPKAWGVGLLIFDEPPFISPTPTDFVSKFTELLTLNFISEVAFFRLLLYPTALWVSRRGFEGISQVPSESARRSRTFASSIAIWNLWALFEMSCLLIAYEELTLAFLYTSWWNQDWWSDMDLCTKNAIHECFNWLIQSRNPSLLLSAAKNINKLMPKCTADLSNNTKWFEVTDDLWLSEGTWEWNYSLPTCRWKIKEN